MSAAAAAAERGAHIIGRWPRRHAFLSMDGPLLAGCLMTLFCCPRMAHPAVMIHLVHSALPGLSCVRVAPRSEDSGQSACVSVCEVLCVYSSPLWIMCDEMDVS